MPQWRHINGYPRFRCESQSSDNGNFRYDAANVLIILDMTKYSCDFLIICMHMTLNCNDKRLHKVKKIAKYLHFSIKLPIFAPDKESSLTKNDVMT